MNLKPRQGSSRRGFLFEPQGEVWYNYRWRKIEGGEDRLESAELAKEVVDAISERKGADIVMLDIRPVSLIADYFVICSGVNERHLKAIVEEVMRRLDEAGINPLHTEGIPSSGWVILDYNSVIVHIFAPAERQYYRLERLWSDAKVVVKIQ